MEQDLTDKTDASDSSLNVEDTSRDQIAGNDNCDANNPSNSGEEDEPPFRIRKDIYNDVDDKTKAILKEIKMKSAVMNTALISAVDKFSSIFESESSGSDKLNVLRELRNVVLKTFYIFDSMYSQVLAEEAFNYDLPPFYSLNQHKQITIEEMSDYFVLLYNLELYLQHQEYDDWRTNLLTLHYRISRILKNYAVSNITSQTENNFMNIVKALGPKMEQFNIHAGSIVHLMDHLKAFSDPIDEMSVWIEHAFIGIKGFDQLTSSIMAKAKAKMELLKLYKTTQLQLNCSKT